MFFAFPRDRQAWPKRAEDLLANSSTKITIEHLLKPGAGAGWTPYHFLIDRVDNERLDMEVHGVDWGSNFRPYRTRSVELRDRAR